ncbi:hypothetical protein HPB52_005871 [Rhipicephalus sanguineus]|uniref:Uncharacterized protein n=1 Tax=Rhipicephalus sanguineus TaxID=34632 RepID=A0A9D4PEW9_RHISA|nr:hypothetical protein HPB52_005871 [Rhipicephalus sanguineus]
MPKRVLTRSKDRSSGHSDGLSCTMHSPEGKEEAGTGRWIVVDEGDAMAAGQGYLEDSCSPKRHRPDAEGNAGLDIASTG